MATIKPAVIKAMQALSLHINKMTSMSKLKNGKGSPIPTTI